MYTTEYKPGTGSECEFQKCDRMARFKVITSEQGDTPVWLCSACLAKCIEAVMGLRATVQELEGL